jgi:hypothetical protein
MAEPARAATPRATSRRCLYEPVSTTYQRDRDTGSDQPPPHGETPVVGHGPEEHDTAEHIQDETRDQCLGLSPAQCRDAT